MFCENCGSPLPDDSKFCLNCGAKTAGTESGGQALQETAVVTDTVQVDTEVAADTVLQPEQQSAPAENIQYEPQPKPVPPMVQPSQPQPAPRPEPPRYAPPQPAPQVQTYQQPVPQAKEYQQPFAPASQLEIPKSDKPLPTWKFMGIMILMQIPIIGFIMVLVWTFGQSWNKNTRNFARAILIFGIIGFVLTVVGIIINLEAIKALLDYFNSNFEIGIV